MNSMKKVILMTACAMLALNVAIAQGQAKTVSYQKEGIQFTKKAWKDVLVLAKAEKKIIFIDAYTTWCGPCKRMSRNVFPDKMVGELYNKQFVNVKMDMEKGEGRELASKYAVKVYPTLLFIDSNGELMHRSAGFHTVPQFIKLGQDAADPMRRLSALNIRYMQGDRDPDFLYDYTYARFRTADGSHLKIAEEYLKTQKAWRTAKNMKFIFDFVTDTDSKLFDFLIEYRSAFEEVIGKTKVSAKIERLINLKMTSIGGDPASFAQIDRLFEKAYPEKAAEWSSRFRMDYYRMEQNAEKFAEATIEHFSNFPAKDADELNDAAWTFYEVVGDKKLLKKAVKWSKQAIEMDNNYYNNDTLAALYFKLKKKGKARKTALNAIEIARAAGEDYSETERLLKRMKEKS